MASAFGHALLAGAIGQFKTFPLKSSKFWFLMIVAAVIPDADVIAFKFGIPYEHPLGHRGFSHSLLFSLVLALTFTILFFRNCKKREFCQVTLLFFLSGVSHSFLDCMTDGGLGVGWFIPFHNERYFFPFRPIKVSPLSIKSFFSMKGIDILLIEGLWIGGMALSLFAIKQLLVLKKTSRSKNP